MAVVEFDKVNKAWGETVTLHDIDLRIEDGEFVAVLGPSGCGKSTTLFLLAGVYAATSGDLRFDGHRINEVEARDRNVGIVFQSYALYPHMNVYENIRFPLRYIKNLSTSDQQLKIKQLATMVEVDHLLDRKPSQLSGGQQQRVALARALIKDPNLLLLDEPLSNLDATLRLTMRTEIKDLQRRTGVTTLLVTHDQIEAMTMADRVVCMDEGKIAQVDTPQDIYNKPVNMFVAKFVGAPPINFVAASADGTSLRVGDTSWSSNSAISGNNMMFAVRPEHIVFADQDSGLAGTIKRVEPMGRETLYTVDSELGTVRILRNESIPFYASADQVRIQLDEEYCLLFDTETGNRVDVSLRLN